MILGRTHLEVAPVWYRPIAGDPALIVAELASLCEPGTVIDISSQPALWGGLLTGEKKSYMSRSSIDIESAMNEKHAADLLDAHLIETLSSIGSSKIDFYALRVRKRWEESVITGAISALEVARQDGMIGHFGLCVEGSASVVMAMWQFHDAFDFLICMPESFSILKPLATARRVGVVLESNEPVSHIQLATIRGLSLE